MHLTVHDPEWLPEDTTAALEYLAYERTICSGCGHSKLDSMDPAKERLWYAEDIRCHACKAIQGLAHQLHKDDKADTDGLYFIAALDDEPEDREDGW